MDTKNSLDRKILQRIRTENDGCLKRNTVKSLRNSATICLEKYPSRCINTIFNSGEKFESQIEN